MDRNRRVVVPVEDPVRDYTPDEEARLTHNLHALLLGVHSGVFSSFHVDSRLLFALHRNIFHNVRGHAGRCRNRDFGSEHVIFGPHRSVHRNEVEAELQKVFSSFQRNLSAIESDPEHPDYERSALQRAVILHADIIRIHPFEDGNGRTCRALMNAVLVRLGLLPVSVEVPKQEYLSSLNHYFTEGDSGKLIALVVELYAASLRE